MKKIKKYRALRSGEFFSEKTLDEAISILDFDRGSNKWKSVTFDGPVSSYKDGYLFRRPIKKLKLG